MSRPRVFDFRITPPQDINLLHDVINNFLKSKNAKSVWSLEKSKENGILHAQGVIDYNKGQNSVQAKHSWVKFAKENNYLLHFAVAGNPDKLRSYVIKEDTHVQGPFYINCEKPKIYEMKDIPMDRWTKLQQEIIDIVDNDNQDRLVLWFYDPFHGCGKTKLCKYFVMKRNALCLGWGSYNDYMNSLVESKGKEFVLFNLVKDRPPKISEADLYSAAEGCKDGLLYSGKYHSGNICCEPMKVVVFSNKLPNPKFVRPNGVKVFFLSKPDDDIHKAFIEQSYVVCPK